MTNAKVADVKKQLQELEEKIEDKIRKEYKQEFQKELKKVRSEFEKKLTDIENKFVSELSAKDHQILEINKELIEVKKGAEFISKKLDDSDAVYNENLKEESKQTKNLLSTIGELKEKTRDLEDRGRRQNLVFFNIPEVDGQEDCNEKVNKLLYKAGILDQDDNPMQFDRAHRLGARKKNVTRPRPIIVKFTFYKGKEFVYRQGHRLRGYIENMSEDFSKSTLMEHKELAKFGKTAKDNNLIRGYRITYRRMSVQHTNPSDTEKSFYKTYSLQFINKHAQSWYTFTDRDTKTI